MLGRKIVTPARKVVPKPVTKVAKKIKHSKKLRKVKKIAGNINIYTKNRKKTSHYQKPTKMKTYISLALLATIASANIVINSKDAKEVIFLVQSKSSEID